MLKPIKLYEALRQLQPAEWTRYQQFIHSGLAGVNPDSQRLLTLLLPFYPDFDRDKLLDEVLFDKLFPGEPYQNEVLRTLRKYLLDQLMDFLAWHQWQQDELQVRVLRMEAAYQKNLPKIYEGERRRLDQLLLQEPAKDAAWFRNAWLMKELDLVKTITSGKRSELVELDAFLHDLGNEYLLRALRLTVSGLNQQELFGQAFALTGLPALAVEYCQANQASLEPTVELYFRLYGMLALPDHRQHFERLRLLLQANDHILREADLENVYNQAINYCNQQYRAGDPAFEGHMFSLYRRMLDLGLLWQANTLSANHFKNLVTLALRLGELAWASSFMESHAGRLEGKAKEAVYTYNLAHLRFFEGRHSEVLRLLQQVDFLDPFYRISAQMLMLKVYYEQRDIEPFLSLIDSFQGLIRRREWPMRRKMSYLNFARLLKALMMVKIGRSQKEAFLRKLQQASPLIDREWLQQAAEAL